MQVSRRLRTHGLAGIGIGLCCLLTVAGSAKAATFCVMTAEELESALVRAESNGEDDVVRLVQGRYDGSFAYVSDEAWTLTIEGGYLPDCVDREVEPAKTVLDGLEAAAVLVVNVTQPTDIVVDGLTLQNGAETTEPGGGLVAMLQGGTFTLSHSTVTNNRSVEGAGAGVFVSGATTVTLTRNTISRNTGEANGGEQFL